LKTSQHGQNHMLNKICTINMCTKHVMYSSIR